MKVLWRITKIVLVAVYALCGLALVLFLVPATGWQAKDVATGSMRPAIMPGSLVIIHKVPLSSLTVGDVVTYTKTVTPPVTITHRIVGIKNVRGARYFTVKGDANPAPDPVVPGGLIVGKVMWHVPAVGKLTAAARTMIGVLLIVVLPGLVIIADEIIRLRKALAKTAPGKAAEPPRPAAPKAHTQRIEKPAAKPASAPAQTQRRRPPLDAVKPRQLGALIVLAGAGALAAHATYSAATANAVSISKINLSAQPTTSPSQFPCPPGFVLISETGAGSVNIFTCRSTYLVHNITINITLAKNINVQTAQSGNVSGGGTSGNSSNSNTTTNTVNNTTTPSPTPSAAPSPSPAH